MTLSEQQLTFFETFGYLVFPRLFADEADAISDGNYYVGDTTGTPMATRARSIAISSSPSTWIRSRATQGACA